MNRSEDINIKNMFHDIHEIIGRKLVPQEISLILQCIEQFNATENEIINAYAFAKSKGKKTLLMLEH
jgi:DNA replication protein DnaD